MSGSIRRYIGIDYSGRGEPRAGNAGIQVYEAGSGTTPEAVSAPSGKYWSRSALGDWLIGEMKGTPQLIVGLDHGFSFPKATMAGHADWGSFLAAFRAEWRADEKPVTKELIRQKYAGHGKPLRLTEQWTSSAKSVFDCDGPGVACSTFAGLPWLLRIREKYGDQVFFWPFDGWDPPSDRHVVVEVYPSLFRHRYPGSGLAGDALDAYAVARWLQEMDGSGFLGRYFNPPLTEAQKAVARLEGWIMGVA